MSDQLFHKRQRKEADLRRKKAFRKPAMRYLIVTEGEKTEPFYLAALRDHLRINRENLRIHPKKCGLDPSRLVELALEEHRNDPNYNIIFCVFDRDSHHSNSRFEQVISVNLFDRLLHCGGEGWKGPSMATG